MSKFASFLGRKTQAAASPPPGAPAAPHSAATGLPENNVIEIDQELFFPIATQLGEDNETVRNLLIDAEHKISELETIKRSIGNLVDPVSKTLRAYEETKNQKIGLQTQLNSTRIAYNKQREALNIAEQRVGALEAERSQVRELLTIAQHHFGDITDPEPVHENVLRGNALFGDRHGLRQGQQMLKRHRALQTKPRLQVE